MTRQSRGTLKAQRAEALLRLQRHETACPAAVAEWPGYTFACSVCVLFRYRVDRLDQLIRGRTEAKR